MPGVEADVSPEDADKSYFTQRSCNPPANPSGSACRVLGQRAPGEPLPQPVSGTEISQAFCLGLVRSLLKLDAFSYQ